jgi:hypothetical protein
MSAIGWVDFSSEHREKVKQVLDSISTPGVVDELGIGVLRDSFSDSLFPGISTIQTRAKYFLTVPRIFKDYEKIQPNKRRRKKLSVYLNEEENRCMEAMVANHEDDPQGGIIGESFAKTQGEVQRKPSSVYWTGIRKFGLIRTSLSLQAFNRKFANPDQPLLDLIQGSDKTTGDDPDAAGQANATINGPAYEENWIESLTIQLSKEEASFLSNQIQTRVPHSLIGQILLDPEIRNSFLELPGDWNFTTLADEAPFLGQFPNELQRIIVAARDFWQLMEGAHIRYNCLLQRRHGTKEVEDEFEAMWRTWLDRLQSFRWARWNTDCLWELAKLHQRHVKSYTVTFVTDWIDAVHRNDSTALLDELVTRQERFNKKGRARLHPSADEKVDKWVGIDDLNYRLNVARTIVNDIQHGLNSEAEDA